MNKLIIMRGIPGSGKSTKAAQIANGHNGTVTIRSTDDQFKVGGVYIFNPRLLGVNHANNQRLVKEDMQKGISLIIVDNTNIKRRDFAPYIQMAKTFGYEVVEEIIQAPPFSDEYVKMCAERNQHGVPFESIRRMADNFEV